MNGQPSDMSKAGDAIPLFVTQLAADGTAGDQPPRIEGGAVQGAEAVGPHFKGVLVLQRKIGKGVVRAGPEIKSDAMHLRGKGTFLSSRARFLSFLRPGAALTHPRPPRVPLLGL